jgi:hypothetical protein
MPDGSEVSIRSCKEGDFPALLSIWRRVGLTIGLSDAETELKRLLNGNPDTCLVGELNGRVIAGVIGGFDGRRGWCTIWRWI